MTLWAEIKAGASVQLMIRGRPVSWKNSPQMIEGRGGRPIPVKSKAQRRWLKAALVQLADQWRNEPKIPKDARLNAAIVSYLATKGMIDSDNLYGAPHDAMQAAEVLEDDVSIQTHDGSDRLYDKDDPRVEITLSLYDPSDGRRARPVSDNDVEF
jgi:Holliday junction resolvase RusA-like endonuclease